MDVREAVLRGSVGVPRAELLARAEAIEARAAALQEESVEAEERPRSRAARSRSATQTPDAMNGSQRRGKRGGEVL